VQPRPRLLSRSRPSDFGHSARVAVLAGAFADRLGWNAGRLGALAVGAALHDIGKCTVPASILRKPGGLTASELAAVRRHPGAGARLIRPVTSLHYAVPCVLFHHERWDGAGYPSGRCEAEIPTEARLLSVIDAFDAMVSDRPYRAALSVEEALAELERCAGTQFDPALAEAFVRSWRAGALRGLASTALPTPRASTAFA
jgi:HD-GYP domain-containing protein (c-di-GMP phosphodiesterase class II)